MLALITLLSTQIQMFKLMDNFKLIFFVNWIYGASRKILIMVSESQVVVTANLSLYQIVILPTDFGFYTQAHKVLDLERQSV